MKTFKWSSLAVFSFFLLSCVSISAIGMIPDDEYKTILALANSNSMSYARISDIGIDANTNALQIKYYLTSTNRYMARVEIFAFYMSVQKNFPSVNGCQYIETDTYGNILGSMYTRPEWYNELIWLSNTKVTEESLANFISRTTSTFRSYGQSYDSSPIKQSHHTSSTSSTSSSYKSTPTECLCSKHGCEEWNAYVDKVWIEDGLINTKKDCSCCVDP